MIKNLRNYRPDELVAGTFTIGFADCTGHEDRNIPGRNLIFFDDIPVRLFKLRKIKRGTGQVWSRAPVRMFPVFLITHVLPYRIVPDLQELNRSIRYD